LRGVRGGLDQGRRSRVGSCSYWRIHEERIKYPTTFGLKEREHDRYSRERLATDLESLRAFYQNQGYLDFNVESTQVSITPDHHVVSTDAWVSFKAFGFLPLTFLFALAQVPLMQRHGEPLAEPNSEEEKRV